MKLVERTLVSPLLFHFASHRPHVLSSPSSSSVSLFLVARSSKTPVKSSFGGVASSLTIPRGTPFPYPVQVDSNITLVSQKPSSLPAIKKQVRRRKEILRMEEEDYRDCRVGEVKEMALIERLEGGWEKMTPFQKIMRSDTKDYTDWHAFWQGDWHLQPVAIKRWWTSMQTEIEILNQEFNPQRNKTLGNDLAIAHFVVYRKGRVRFKGESNWVTEYRTDAEEGKDELDLPMMTTELCTLPVHYDPRYRVEAVDCSGFDIRYEGLVNFQNLSYVKWLSFRNISTLDDWCLDRLTRIFYDTLEHIDVSGCKQVSERGIGTLIRCKKLKTLVVENLPHVKHLEMVAAMLEDSLPSLEIIGIDYEARMEAIRREGEEIERKLQEQAAALEANTVTVEPISLPSGSEENHGQEQQASTGTSSSSTRR